MTAFYTPPEVSTAIYKVLEQMGFQEGNLLEPSCGIGNFIGMLPESMENAKVYGVELDTVSAGIAQQLYQKSSIAAQGFEEVNVPDSFFDGVIGNVPFGDFKVSDKRYDKGGMVNYILMQLHLVESPVSWLQHTWTANLVLWLFGIWKGTGWVMVIYMAALQGIPQEIYEAAELDGANGIRRFFAITLPMVRNTTNYLLTVLTIGAFGAYIHVMMITDGAPLGTTNELMNYMYNTACGPTSCAIILC